MVRAESWKGENGDQKSQAQYVPSRRLNPSLDRSLPADWSVMTQPVSAWAHSATVRRTTFCPLSCISVINLQSLARCSMLSVRRASSPVDKPRPFAVVVSRVLLPSQRFRTWRSQTEKKYDKIMRSRFRRSLPSTPTVSTAAINIAENTPVGFVPGRRKPKGNATKQ